MFDVRVEHSFSPVRAHRERWARRLCFAFLAILVLIIVTITTRS